MRTLGPGAGRLGWLAGPPCTAAPRTEASRIVTAHAIQIWHAPWGLTRALYVEDGVALHVLAR